MHQRQQRPRQPMQRAAPMSSIQPRISAQQARLEVGLEMRAHFEHASLETSMIPQPRPDYRAGLAASRPPTYRGDSWCCPAGGPARESNFSHG
jgi:hypothetical protein